MLVRSGHWGANPNSRVTLLKFRTLYTLFLTTLFLTDMCSTLVSLFAIVAINLLTAFLYADLYIYSKGQNQRLRALQVRHWQQKGWGSNRRLFAFGYQRWPGLHWWVSVGAPCRQLPHEYELAGGHGYVQINSRFIRILLATAAARRARPLLGLKWQPLLLLQNAKK